MMAAMVEQALLAAVSAARGHFRYESGHHGDLWLDLDRLFVEARSMQAWVSALAAHSAALAPQVVCGALSGGAFVAQLMAIQLGVQFAFTERLGLPTGAVQYALPKGLAAVVQGKRVLVVDDAINAGSALRGTLTDLEQYAVQVVGIASLFVMGEAAEEIAQAHGVPLISMVRLTRNLWLPETCPLCQANIALSTPTSS